MEDIRKQIEEEAKKYADFQYEDSEDRFGILYDETIRDYIQGANFILSKWQQATRWRKVEEGTPEILSEEPYFILVKSNDNSIYTLYIEEETNCIDQLVRYYEYWKPIH